MRLSAVTGILRPDSTSECTSVVVVAVVAIVGNEAVDEIVVVVTAGSLSISSRTCPLVWSGCEACVARVSSSSSSTITIEEPDEMTTRCLDDASLVDEVEFEIVVVADEVVSG